MMTDSELQVQHFVENLETFTLGRWMVNMQNVASKLPANSKEYIHLCIRFAAKELRNRYVANK
jgi:hypothetical protein